MPLEILAGFHFQQVHLHPVLQDEIDLPGLLAVVVVELEPVSLEFLGHDVFQNTAHVDLQVTVQQRKLNIFHAGRAQQTRVPLKELKEIVFLIQPKGRLRFRHIITRQGHPRVRQPLEAVGIALLAAVGVQGRQDEAAVLFTQLGGDAVKDRPNFELVVPISSRYSARISRWRAMTWAMSWVST